MIRNSYPLDPIEKFLYLKKGKSWAFFL